MEPIGGWVHANDPCRMVQISIRCRRSIPVAADELEGWLEKQVSELRLAAPRSIVRLSRLVQGSPDAQIHIGWLVELEIADGEPLLDGSRLDDALRDMRLLGLQPSMLTPARASADRRAA
jgi:hypothetical protein